MITVWLTMCHYQCGTNLDRPPPVFFDFLPIVFQNISSLCFVFVLQIWLVSTARDCGVPTPGSMAARVA